MSKCYLSFEDIIVYYGDCKIIFIVYLSLLIYDLNNKIIHFIKLTANKQINSNKNIRSYKLFENTRMKISKKDVALISEYICSSERNITLCYKTIIEFSWMGKADTFWFFNWFSVDQHSGHYSRLQPIKQW